MLEDKSDFGAEYLCKISLAIFDLLLCILSGSTLIENLKLSHLFYFKQVSFFAISFFKRKKLFSFEKKYLDTTKSKKNNSTKITKFYK